ncbi:hypothetical protein [Thalassospira povalilytica]|uniref:hypothetical protein n=1 Tax=Thalassospira povalilytica TaxID=732237 RepID=UPI003AA99673
MKNHSKIVSVLVYYDEPQVILLQGKKNIHAIAVAVNKEGMDYPFFCCEVYKKDWLKYKNQKADLYFLFENALSNKYYFFDLNKQINGNVELINATKDEKYDLEYWPERGFFASNHTEILEEDNEKSASTQVFDIDGAWAAIDFSSFYSKMADLYGLAFVDHLLEDRQQARKATQTLKSSIINKLWRGGGSYVGFYSDLIRDNENMTPLNVKKIQYASPGTIEFSGDLAVFNEMMRYLEKFSQNRDISANIYKSIDQALSKEKLKKADPNTTFSSEALTDYIVKSSHSLIELMGIGKPENLFEACDKNAVIYAKLSLSIHRRLKGIHDFYSEGRVANPETIEHTPYY